MKPRHCLPTLATLIACLATPIGRAAEAPVLAETTHQERIEPQVRI